jgi:hypothetical protein
VVEVIIGGDLPDFLGALCSGSVVCDCGVCVLVS